MLNKILKNLAGDPQEMLKVAVDSLIVDGIQSVVIHRDKEGNPSIVKHPYDIMDALKVAESEAVRISQIAQKLQVENKRLTALLNEK